MFVLKIFLIVTSYKYTLAGFSSNFGPHIWPPNLLGEWFPRYGGFSPNPNYPTTQPAQGWGPPKISNANNSGEMVTPGVYTQDMACLAIGGVCTDVLSCGGAGGYFSSDNNKCPSSPNTIRCCRSPTIHTFVQDQKCTGLGGVCTDQPSCEAIWRFLNPTNAECPSSPANIRCCLSVSGPVYPQDTACTAVGGLCLDAARCTSIGRQFSPTNAECPSTPDTVRCCRPGYTQDPRCSSQGGHCTDQTTCTAMHGQMSSTNPGCPSNPANVGCCLPLTYGVIFQDPECLALGGFCTGRSNCAADGGKLRPTNAECRSTQSGIRCCLLVNTTISTPTPSPTKPALGTGWTW